MQSSVLDCVGAALRFARECWRPILITSAIGAVATTAVIAVGLTSPVLAIFGDIAIWLAQALVFAAFVKAALGDSSRVNASDGLRVFAAMAVIGFFLFLTFFVLMIPGAMVLVSGPMAPYVDDMQRAGQDQAAMMQVMQRFAAENPSALLAFVLFYGVLWFLLTSRLYLSAPATVDAKRVLTFDTWRWTRSMTLRISAARLLLLAPAFVLMASLTYFAGRALGIDVMAAPAHPNLAAFTAYAGVNRILFFATYLALEAGLSVALYRALKPAEEIVAQA